MNSILSFRWLGSEAPHLDTPVITTCRDVVIGCYGGHTGAGASRNEDGALVWCAADGSWEFALLLDAHASADSAALVLTAIGAEAEAIAACLSRPIETAFASLQQHVLALFQSSPFREQCAHIQGETACLLGARKAQFLWWLSVGDCVVYLFHPELARLGQFTLNQRSFFEWIGHANSFNLPVPCSATGVRELRAGQNRIVMTTDGLLECGTRPFEDPRRLYELFGAEREGVEASVQSALARVHQERGRDSATIVAWGCRTEASGLQSSE
jgi:serine/threonine protein phosphatase PrpC